MTVVEYTNLYIFMTVCLCFVFDTAVSTDIDVTCIYSAECLLPCTSTNLDIIHWYKDTKQVHSYYYNKDQLSHQSEDYKGRTSLLPQSEIKNGDVSLLLKNIRVQDEGRYKCYTANEKTNDEKFVFVSVEGERKNFWNS